MTRGLEADWRNFFFAFFSDKFQFPEVGRAIFLISKAGKFCKLKLYLEEASVNSKGFLPLFEYDSLLRVDDDRQYRGCQDLYSLSNTHGLQGLSSG